MSLNSKTAKKLIWISVGIVLIASAALGAHIYVKFTIEDAISFLERSYDLEGMEYRNYSFDLAKQALVINDVKTKKSHVAASSDDQQNTQLNITVDKIIYEKCDFKSAYPKYCNVGLEGVKATDEDGKDFFADFIKAITRSDETKNPPSSYGINMYLDHDTDSKGIQTSQGMLSVKDRFDYSFTFKLANIDWEDLEEKNRRQREAMRSGTYNEEDTQLALKDTIQAMKNATVYHVSLGFTDSSDVMKHLPLDSMSALLGAYPMWNEFIVAPKKIKIGATYKDGVNLDSVINGQYKPEDLSVQIDLNGRNFPEGQELAKSAMNQVMQPQYAEMVAGYIEKIGSAVEQN